MCNNLHCVSNAVLFAGLPLWLLQFCTDPFIFSSSLRHVTLLNITRTTICLPNHHFQSKQHMATLFCGTLIWTCTITPEKGLQATQEKQPHNTTWICTFFYYTMNIHKWIIIAIHPRLSTSSCWDPYESKPAQTVTRLTWQFPGNIFKVVYSASFYLQSPYFNVSVQV